MTAKRLFIAADMDRTLMDAVASDERFSFRQKPVRSEAALREHVGDAEVLVTRAFNAVTRAVIESAPHLRLIAQGTSGTDNIDHMAAADRGIQVISLPGENANAVAELVIGMMISLTRTVPSYRNEVVAGRWNRDDCSTRHELAHYTLGIVGLGEVGRRVARLATAFGMKVVAYDPYIDDAAFAARHASRVASLDELLSVATIVTLHVPHTAETRRFIAQEQIATLRRGSYLINASRGEVLDWNAAMGALDSGHLAGVAIDVYDPEPPEMTIPDRANLIVTPHIAGCSHEAKASIGRKLYRKICDVYWPAT